MTPCKHLSQTLLLLTATVLPALFPAVSDAQEYRFSVPKLQMLVTVRPDASVHIVYDITFKNMPGAHAIDIVDIGTPHGDYSLGNVSASCGGRTLGDIRHSTIVKPGFEVHMGPSTIPQGGEGTLHVEFDMPEMVFQDTTNEKLASMRITPTWFGDQYVVGNTHIQVAVQLPQSVTPDEALHQGFAFNSKAQTDAGALVGWDWPAERLTGPHMVAVSFPKRDLNNVIRHADATSATIRLIASHPKVILTIEDDGKGFDVEQRRISALKERRLGLRTMAERVRLLQGTMRIRSAPGKGTAIRIEVPHEERNRR